MRGSITHARINETTEVIGTNIEYAPFVELGTYKMKAKPFLKPAIMKNRKEYKAIVNEILKNG
ncbi:MAG: hypothetical protein RR662_05265 [Clostridia bacterium]